VEANREGQEKVSYAHAGGQSEARAEAAPSRFRELARGQRQKADSGRQIAPRVDS